MNNVNHVSDQQQYWIPKSAVKGVFHLLDGEKVEGEIYLEMRSVNCSTSQLLEFFNAEEAFFPVKTSTSSVLVSKPALVKAEFPMMMAQFMEETASALCVRKDAELSLRALGVIKATLILDLPEEHSRLLDLLNAGCSFIPAIHSKTYVLFNRSYIHSVREI